MALATDDILALFRKHYPPAKRSPEGWILLPRPQIAVIYQPLLPQNIDLSISPKVKVPEYLEGWSTRELWEDHWVHKQEIVASRLLSLIGHTERIHGRKTEARRIDQPTALEFMERNHVLGGTKAKLKYGLFQGDRLVAAATFSGARKITREGKEGRSYELIRACNLLGTTVVGGMSKLLKAFIREHQPDDIMTYVGLDWSEGRMYEQFGFERVGTTEAQWLTVDPETGRRALYDKDKSHDPNTKLAWYPGNAKYVWVL